ncbi:Slp family lipoprotein [Vibrio sp. AK197]
MSIRGISRYLLMMSSLLMISACASLPQELETQNPAVVTDFQTWQANPNDQQEVRLGGVIANISNLSDKTRLEIVNMPIGNAGKPMLSHEPKGRFVAYVQGFLDPVTYSEGRLITVLGDSAGTEEGSVDKYQHQFPVVNARAYHLWRVEERVIINDIDPFYPCYGFNCRVWRHPISGNSGRVIQEVK